MPFFAKSSDEQPFTTSERYLINEVFALLEQRYGARLWLVVFRNADGDMVVQDPNEQQPDWDKLADKVTELGNFLLEVKH